MEKRSGGNWPPCESAHVRAPSPICFKLFTQLIRCALDFALANAGRKNPGAIKRKKQERQRPVIAIPFPVRRPLLLEIFTSETIPRINPRMPPRPQVGTVRIPSTSEAIANPLVFGGAVAEIAAGGKGGVTVAATGAGGAALKTSANSANCEAARQSLLPSA